MLTIKAAGLTFGYDSRAIFSGLDAEIPLGKATVILGANGSGKSTLAKLLLGHLRPQLGGFSFPSGFDQSGRTTAVYQDVSASLLPWLSAVENVALPLRCQGVRRDAARASALSLMSDLADKVDPSAFAGKLSGGQQQLVAWARAFVTAPALVILDEPFASLDMRRIARLSGYLAKRVEEGLTAILVLHDLDQALLLADSIMVLTSRPGEVPLTLEIRIPKPRTADSIITDEALSLRREILTALWS